MEKKYLWVQSFRELFDRCCQNYISGNEDWESYYSKSDREFLSSIGCRPREFFDFIEDHCDTEDHEEPSYDTALLVAAARRDYFLQVQGGVASEQTITAEGLPDRGEELGGYAWLPRILVKAKAKLMGELDPEIMYGCGGDRQFLSSIDTHPADFLRIVWSLMASGQQDALILEALASKEVTQQ